MSVVKRVVSRVDLTANRASMTGSSSGLSSRRLRKAWSDFPNAGVCLPVVGETFIGMS